MTQEQLRYTLFLLTTFQDPIEVKTRMLLRFAGLQVYGRAEGGWLCYYRKSAFGRRHMVLVRPWEIESLLGEYSFVDSYEELGCRLDAVHGLRAVDTLLHGVSFLDYLNLEKYYQAYHRSRQDRFLDRMGRILYRRKDGSITTKLMLDKEERLGVFLWYSYVKTTFGKAFPHFFRKVEGGDGNFDMRKSIDAQIRALSDGDVTRESEILATDCWRALTELDAKAREAEEVRRELQKHKRK